MGRIRDQHADEVVSLQVQRDGTVSGAAGDGAALDGLPMARCAKRGGRSAVAQLQLRPTSGDSERPALPPELSTAGVTRIAVTLQPTARGDLVAQIEVTRRLKGLEPMGYPAIASYWLLCSRAP